MDMVLCIALMGGYIYGDIKDYFGGLIGEHGGGGMINGISFKGGMGDGHHNSYSQQYHLTRHRGYKFQLMYFVFFLYHTFQNSNRMHYGRSHLVHLRIHKYFMNDSSVNFHDKIFLHFF